MRHREALQRFNELTDDAIMVTDAMALDEPGPAILYVNPAFGRLTGYTAAEVVGRSPRFLHGPDTDSEAKARIRAALEQRARVDVDILNYRRDGSTFWNNLTIHPIRNDKGDCVAFLGVLHDVTERKRLEESLRQSEAKFRAVAELMPLAVAVTRWSDGRILFGNQWLARFYGVTQQELAGRSITEIYGNLRDREHLLARLSVEETVTGLEIAGHRPDGTVAHALINATRLRFDGEDAILVVGTDISPQKRLEQALRSAERRAQDALMAAEAAARTRTQFFAAASHDLRQPHQAMRLLLHLLTVRLTDPEALEIADKLSEAMETGEALLSALLDVATLEAGTVQPRTAEFPIRDFIERLAREFSAQAEARGLDFRVVAGSGIVRSDPVLLRRILSNLFANAIKYTPAGGILLGSRRRGDRVRVELWDTGIGIPGESQGIIFEDFVQLGNPQRDRRQGLGLGLAVVARMARLLDHTVSVRSTPGKGSVFAVDLPLANATEAPNALPPERPPSKALDDDGVVLVVEDDPIILDGLVRLVRDWGFRPVSALSLDALSGAISGLDQPPRLIVADYRLQGGATGSDAISLVRGHFRADIPAIVLTGDTQPDRIREITREGHALLFKPVRPDKLKDMMDRMVAKSGKAD